MKLAVEFPSVFYRGGPAAIVALAQGLERLQYDQLDMFDHVTMGYPREGRPSGPYPATMPLLEALTTLAFVAAVTQRIGLGTEVLVLPQRQPALVAKQVATVDILSGGRVRLGVGVGWQEAEYESLDVPFRQRGSRMDEALKLIRAYWSEPHVEFTGRHYRAADMAMDPKPRPGTSGPPVWIGGSAEAALRRVAELGDGWLAGGMPVEQAAERIAFIRRHAEAAGRDPAALGFQAQLGDPRDLAALAGRAAAYQAAGFGWGTVNMTVLYTAGARTPEAQLESLAEIRERVLAETGE